MTKSNLLEVLIGRSAGTRAIENLADQTRYYTVGKVRAVAHQAPSHRAQALIVHCWNLILCREGHYRICGNPRHEAMDQGAGSALDHGRERLAKFFIAATHDDNELSPKRAGGLYQSIFFCLE